METVIDFIFLYSKITVDSDCSHEIKRRLLLGRKAMTNLDNVLKSRDTTLPIKICIVKSYGFSSSPVQIWELDSNKGRTLKIWCFLTLVLVKTLRVIWTARRSNQSILNEISPEYSLEGLMLKLKLQYFGHLMGSTDSLEKTLMLTEIPSIPPGKTEGEGDDRWDGWMASPTQWT